jgi:epoxyqueuosine reductase
MKRRTALEYKRRVDRLLTWEDGYLTELLAVPGLEPCADSPVLGTEQLVARDAELRRSVLDLAQSEVVLDPRNTMDTLPEFYVTQQRVMRGTRRSVKSLAKNRGLTRMSVGGGFIAELESRARDLGISNLGYCKVPPHLVFRGRKVAYSNAIVCVQEMKRCEIETAPADPAGIEAMRVYANLGKAMNSLADWMRDRGVPVQASHPLGGSALYTALAVEANLGYWGRSGLLITPQFGIRQRFGVMFTPVEDLPFAAANEHEWVLDYCDRCNKCLRSCPGEAILEKAVPNTEKVFTSIDIMKCYPRFAITAGCSVCVKVCPFSRGSYDSIKKSLERRQRA